MAACSGCNLYNPWAAFVVGVVTGGLYTLISFICRILQIDDPCESVGSVPSHCSIGSDFKNTYPLKNCTSSLKFLIAILQSIWEAAFGEALRPHSSTATAALSSTGTAALDSYASIRHSSPPVYQNITRTYRYTRILHLFVNIHTYIRIRVYCKYAVIVKTTCFDH